MSEDVEWVFGTVVVVVEVEEVEGTVVVGRETGVVRVVGGLVELVVVVGGVVVVVVTGVLVVVVGSGAAQLRGEGATKRKAAATNSPARMAARRSRRRDVAKEPAARAPWLHAPFTSPHLSEPRCPAAMLTTTNTGIAVQMAKGWDPSVPPFLATPPGAALGRERGGGYLAQPTHMRHRSYRHLWCGA